MSSAKEAPKEAGGNGDTPQALKSWWATFKKGKRKAVPAAETKPVAGIFGVPLKDSIQYANVAISLMDDEGKSFIYGYVPIVVAKCGVFLKEKATDVEGIFRLSGSAKRIKELQAQFDAPPRYGKGLDWTGYTVHDAANVFRRYLNQLPQPIVPLEFYEKFRTPLRGHQSQAVGNSEERVELETVTEDFNLDKAITIYQELITQIPPLNRQLLLYILDLLSVFAFKSDVNRMTSANLAAIFQPGMLSHPDHDMAPAEYRLSQDVIIFLIDNQDSFLIGMSGTAADEKTVREVQAGPPTTPSKSAGLGRSISNASGGADSARKFGGVRRNISISSKNSKHSSAAQTPVTPQSGGFSNTSGVHRSNTVPSKRSPGLSSTRGRGVESPTTSVALATPIIVPAPAPPTSHPPATPTVTEPTSAAAVPAAEPKSVERQETDPTTLSDSPPQNDRLAVEATPPKSKSRPGFLKQTPSSDGKDGRQPNKLKKKRDPVRSANSSTNSLSNAEYIDSLPVPKEPTFATAPQIGAGLEESMGPSTLHTSQQTSHSTLRGKSPAGSAHSKSSLNDHSEQEHSKATTAENAEPTEAATAAAATAATTATDTAEKVEKNEKNEKAEKAEKKRWRFSTAPKKDKEKDTTVEGANPAAGKSTGSFGSNGKARAPSHDGSGAILETVPSEQTQTETSSTSKDKDADEPEQKRGLFGRLKARVEKSREEHRAKEAEKDHAKSKTPPGDHEHSSSKHSLSQVVQDIMPHRERSSADAKEHVGGNDGAADEKAAEAAVPNADSNEPSAGNKGTAATESEPQVLEANGNGQLHLQGDSAGSKSNGAAKETPASPPANALTETSTEQPVQAPTQASTGEPVAEGPKTD